MKINKVLWVIGSVFLVGCVAGLMAVGSKEVELSRPLTEAEFREALTTGSVLGGSWGVPLGFVLGAFTKRTYRVILKWMAIGVLVAGASCGIEGYAVDIRSPPKQRTKDQIIRNTLDGLVGGAYLGILVAGFAGIQAAKRRPDPRRDQFLAEAAAAANRQLSNEGPEIKNPTIRSP